MHFAKLKDKQNRYTRTNVAESGEHDSMQNRKNLLLQ